MTKEQIIANQAKTLSTIHSELDAGFKLLSQYPKSVTIFGSARFREGNVYYTMATELGRRITKELGYTIMTGGGPGIMEGASKGVSEAGGKAVGITIKLPHEQRKNPYVETEITCNHFMTRKSILTYCAEAWIFFPGGFGTFDELFGILTLVQTGKIPLVPIILVGKDFWQKIDGFIKEEMLSRFNTVSEIDVNLYKITDDEDEILQIIKNAPVRDWWTDASE